MRARANAASRFLVISCSDRLSLFMSSSLALWLNGVMSLSNEQKTELRLTTRESAIAFVEDLEHIREALARRQTSRGELRRMSAILRRLLVERDIAKIAVPRFDGRMYFKAPDRKPFYDAAKRMRCLFFASGGASIFGQRFDSMAMWNAGQRGPPKSVSEIFPEAKDHGKEISLRLDNFLSQRVLCYHENWATRREAIKHVAIFGSGVHSTPPEKDEDKIIAKMRTSCIYRIRDDVLKVHVMPELGADSAEFTMNQPEGSPPFDFKASDLDVVLVEVLAAAELLVNSPDVLKLKKIV